MTETVPKDLFEGDLVFNGINAETGDYALSPMTSKRLARLISGNATEQDRQAWLARERALNALSQREKAIDAQEQEISLEELDFKVQQAGPLGGYPVKEGVDPTSLEQAGWAVVFPAWMNANRLAAIKEALDPLLKLRQSQAQDLFRIYEGRSGYGLKGRERKDQFFSRQKPEIREGPADPAQMPFYVLLVGSPEEIPYKFQFQLDVMRGVGRIDFGNDLEAYNRYAKSVVAADPDNKEILLPRRASFFGVNNPGDKATRLSDRWLVRPLLDNLQQRELDLEIPLGHDWQLDAFRKDQATRSQLEAILGGDPAQTPALLFSAGHGLERKLAHSRQRAQQGALVCQEWGGPRTPIEEDHFFAGEHLASSAQVQGMMAFFFACYGAGTPLWDDFARQAFRARSQIAARPFIAALPQRLLSLGALAVIGHVERAWGYSFVTPKGNLDNQAFITALRKLMNGDPIGLATDPSFNLRYAAKSSNLSTVLEDEEFEPGTHSAFDLAYLWTANNDARNYVVLGDPAARLPVGDVAPAEAVRPTIEVAHFEPLPVEAEEEPSEPGVSLAAEQPAGTLVVGPQAFTLGGSIILQPAGVTAAPGESFAVSDAGVSFGLFGRRDKESDEEREERQKLSTAIKGFVENAAAAVSDAVKEATTLQVVTYTSNNINNVDPKDMANTARPKAITRIEALGDVSVCVPQKDGEIDEALWTVHSDMVQQAQANRTELARALIDAVSDLAKVM